MFDTMSGHAVCPHCSEISDVDIQFKWGECLMSYYTIGDYIDGNEPFSILDSETRYNHCMNCEKHFNVYAIGKMGYLHGFANEIQLEELKKILPLENDKEEHFKKITLLIDKETYENPELVAKELTKLIKEKPNETTFIIDKNNLFDEKEVEKLLCRVPISVRDVNNRPKVGDIVWYNNTRSSYEVWDYSDVPFVIKKSNFDEHTQLFFFEIENTEQNIVLENIYEDQLLNEEKANKKRKELIDLENGIIEYVQKSLNDGFTDNQNKLKGFLTLRYKIHAKAIVGKLKNEGKIPSDFEF